MPLRKKKKKNTQLSTQTAKSALTFYFNTVYFQAQQNSFALPPPYILPARLSLIRTLQKGTQFMNLCERHFQNKNDALISTDEEHYKSDCDWFSKVIGESFR